MFWEVNKIKNYIKEIPSTTTRFLEITPRNSKASQIREAAILVYDSVIYQNMGS
jgi:hypothetical protein